MLYQDRKEAGLLLARQLTAYANRSDVLVLALPRGGVPVGFEVAKALNVPLDIFVVRKLGVPKEQELAMGAIASGGVRVLNEDIVRSLNIDDSTINSIAAKEQREIERREKLYLGDRPFPSVQGKIAIVVDDGLATGATMRAAIEALQKQQPIRIIVAVPVGAAQTCEELADQVDEIVCPVKPNPFVSVGFWYQKFPQTTDTEVRQLLERAANNYNPSTINA